MTSKTHIAASAAVTCAIVQPTSIKDLAICLAACTIGGVISDVDVSSSHSHKDLIKIISICSISIIACIIIEYFFDFSVISYIKTSDFLLNAIVGIIAFLAVCSFGITQPHRTFMHSILCVAILTIIVDFTLHPAALPFAIGIISHILLDLLNMKKVQIFYPFKKKIGLKLCSADGKVNKIIFVVSSAVFFVEMIVFAISLLA